MKRVVLLLVVITAGLAHRSDGQSPASLEDQLKLSGVMPRGAMVYVQAADLGALMKMWMASPIRTRFYDSASFVAFTKSRAYLKLQDRRKDIEAAIGVGLDEGRVTELAARSSAVAIYDIGKLEVVFVSEVSRARALASMLFKQSPRFQERSAAGTSYFVKDVTTDGGRLNQQFCYAHFDGKLIVTTTEGLMIRSIANAKGAAGDSLAPDVVATAKLARGFASHEATMWLDQARLNQNRYFDNYWIHQNVESELSSIKAALIDLRFTREGMSEERWFELEKQARSTTDRASAPAEAKNIEAAQLASLIKFAPADTHLIEVRSSTGDALATEVEDALFGKLPEETSAPPEPPDRTRRNSSDDESNAHERYSRLDERFDIDADDENAPKRGPSADSTRQNEKTAPSAPALSDFVKKLSPILSQSMGEAYCSLTRSRNDAGKPFVRFERALVLQLKQESPLNRQTLERMITDELRARFVIRGSQPNLEWKDEGEVRFVAQSMLEQGAAYAVSDNYLVLASSRAFASDALQAAKRASAARPDNTITFYAVLRIAAARPVFDTLMTKLDGRAPARPARATDSEDENREIKFFSENLSSLIAASSIRELRLTRQFREGLMTEHVSYLW